MSPSPITQAGRLGRRLGITSFWLMAVFVIGMSTRSVMGELFGQGASGLASPENVRACAGEIGSLERTLLDRAAEDVRWPHKARDTQRWLRAWDRRYASLESCGTLEPAKQKLHMLRDRTVKMLHAHLREGLPLTEHIERALEHFRDSAKQPSALRTPADSKTSAIDIDEANRDLT